jgi:polysaccharide export outer membrane protein
MKISRTIILWLGAALLIAFNLAHAQEKPEYPLSAGDSIKVQVFQNPDLTVEARISENGTITYPLIGSVAIGGLGIGAAEKKIADALRTGGFLLQPQVNITLAQVRGSQVAVLGQVNKPGRFALDTVNTRITDVLAMAGGPMPTGDDRIVLSGIREGKPFRKLVDIPALFTGGPIEDDFLVTSGDVIYVPRAPVFYIYGEAQRPGSYRIERGMTVMQGLAAGGGPTIRGSETRLRLHRKDASGAVQQMAPNPSDLLQPNDVIYVRESLF